MYLNVIGRLGSDPELKTTPNGKELYSVSLAYTDQKSKDKETVWIRLTMPSIFKNLVPYLKKGSKIFVTGKLNPPKVSEKNGKVYMDLFVSAIELLENKEKKEEEYTPF